MTGSPAARAGLTLPDADRELSPRTGWTRRHWVACADRLLAGAAAHASPAGARVRFPSPRHQDSVDELEGFARSFLLTGLRLADGVPAGRDPDTTSTRAPRDLAERAAAALDAGTSPAHAEAWPAIGHHDQTLVEATAIAVGLHWSRPALWDRLSDRVRNQLVDWLSGARGRWCADNNHVLFGATVQAFLASVGADHDRTAIDGALGRMEEWYAGDGWYSDGTGRRFDHYNGWTFHLYPFFIEQMLSGALAGQAGTDPAFDVYRTRLRMFLDDQQHLVDARGMPVLQGRSLIYRWAVAAPFWMGALQDATPLPPGRTRRLASGMLAGFSDAGVLDRGVLDLGWTRPAPDVLQHYNAPGSPLWASKGFLGLLLPADHPVWQATEQPLPVEERDVVRPLGGPRWLAVGRRDDGVIRLLNHGSDGHPQHDDRLYRRLAFSSATVPVEVAGLTDNTVTVGPPGVPCRHRGLDGGVVRSRGAASSWHLDAQGRDVLVDVATLVLGDAELRLARLRGVLDQPVRCTGWAASADRPVTGGVDDLAASATGADGPVSAIAWVTADGVVRGSLRAGLHSGPHPHALGTRVGLPWLSADAGTDGQVRLAWLVRLGRTGDAGTLAARAGTMRVQWLDDGAHVVADGAHRHCAWVRDPSWRADGTNQGVFRVGSSRPGR